MHTRLRDWYQTVQVEARLDTFDGLVRAAEDRANTVTSDDLAEFIRLAYGISGDAKQRDAFRAELAKHDAAIGMQQDWREVGVLAGVTLMQIVDGKDQGVLNRAAALLLTVGRTAAGDSIPIPYFFEAARTRVIKMAAAARERDRNLDATWLPKSDIVYPDNGAFTTDQAVWLENNLKTLRALANRISLVSERARGGLNAQAEVTDALWWLLGGVSVKTDRELSKIPKVAVGFIVGHDLSRLNRYAIPFRSTRSLARQSLMSAGFDDDPVSLLEGAQAAVEFYRNDAVSDEEWDMSDVIEKAKDLLPVLASLSSCLKGHKNGPDLQLQPSLIAEQLALEVAACEALEALK